MRSDLISREVLLSEYDNNFVRYKDFRDFLENVPDVEIRDSLFVNGYAQGYEDAKKKFERPQGEWKEYKLRNDIVVEYAFKCSNCKKDSGLRYHADFCPNCGARMGVKKNDNNL